MPTLAQLEREWKAASERSMAGAPANVVTEERMRYLVLKWTLEIDQAKAGSPAANRADRLG
jgi:uncharacterized protein (DUF2235 family)